jgi:hypothetical protein
MLFKSKKFNKQCKKLSRSWRIRKLFKGSIYQKSKSYRNILSRNYKKETKFRTFFGALIMTSCRWNCKKKENK